MHVLYAAFLTSACLCSADAAAPPQIVLGDPGYPLWEIRPLDRRVYVLTLDGAWKTPPDRDATYYVNVEYPDGGRVEQRVTDDRLFRRGDVQALLIEYQWEKHHFRRGDRLTVYVTRRDASAGPTDQEMVSNPLEVDWPFDRKVTRLPPRTRFTPREAIDAFRPPSDEPVVPMMPPAPPGP